MLFLFTDSTVDLLLYHFGHTDGIGLDSHATEKKDNHTEKKCNFSVDFEQAYLIPIGINFAYETDQTVVLVDWHTQGKKHASSNSWIKLRFHECHT